MNEQNEEVPLGAALVGNEEEEPSLGSSLVTSDGEPLDNEIEVEEDFQVPPAVLKPRSKFEYEAMSAFLDNEADETIDYLSEISNQVSMTRPMIAAWGMFLSLQRNILFSIAFDEGWDSPLNIRENIKALIKKGLIELAGFFASREQMVEFLQEAEEMLLKGWKKKRREQRKKARNKG